MDKRDASIDVTTNREATFDVMKCIGIIAVIIGHLTSFGQDFIFSLHMPLFFIIAGYFYHEKYNMHSRTIQNTIRKKGSII